MRFGIFANFQRPDAADTVAKVIDWCKKNSHEITLCEEISILMEHDVKSCPCDELWESSDVIISMGGDGTILASVRALGEHSLPILGVNLGSLGFLTQLTPDKLEDALERVVKGDYKIDERMMLKTEVLDETSLESPYALNDVVVDKGNVSRVIYISLYANNEYICSYTADGLIISTPTGSTAYSLAVGGPILTQTMQAIIVSPISPFSLTSRPLIFPPDSILEIKIRSEHGNAMLTIDGQIATKFCPTGSIRVSRANHFAKLIRLEENSFYDILRRKLHWGKLPAVDYKKVDFKD
jgi:NAD+ kinase